MVQLPFYRIEVGIDFLRRVLAIRHQIFKDRIKDIISQLPGIGDDGNESADTYGKHGFNFGTHFHDGQRIHAEIILEMFETGQFTLVL